MNELMMINPEDLQTAFDVITDLAKTHHITVSQDVEARMVGVEHGCERYEPGDTLVTFRFSKIDPPALPAEVRPS